ncbi:MULTISPECIES: cytochrome aa3 quinol oxidase subunit I [unclassified Paenibacillus]|uniref:cytochrome aa3 quinol oxidase subunit I n=1 Tax=unclassified Paenibacillus TaxID=185978 RepID=UPI001AE694A1|nr:MULTISPECIES: cytochrome aa3 quinol oxidase subunit I [unclassified Paenibacillus]MBP1154253.1 cytochrome aa3-600 menaquinol oxidase subunit 1 [Paenibacillus sp. PvP091]MBP1170362.1 cytochrome aa3-600 menaquinol oxidase subunit 1 [Paenibacillus sp. PvR098]MBP2441390.1 cytochrome aa3-600 menaquinol oxidase subunit 1 [Paenibacillus sp. PvP052]
MGIKWNEIFITGDPMILGAQISIVLTIIGIVGGLTYLQKWKWLWREWLTTVDHKRIGIMYIIAAILMFFRGGMDGLLMKAQTSRPEMELLNAQHYNEIFTTHGVIMILFMAMPFLIGLMNVIIPLQIGARDVAFPQLNAWSFWLFFSGAMLFNISFVIGGSPDAGWTSYFPLAGKEFSPGIGNNYYAIALQIAGIGTLMTGINFIVTILKMRTKGMTLMRMPMFTWTTFITSVIIVASFPIFTVALALMTFDRLYGTHFFTLSGGGMDMLWANLFWLWAHPEVYIVALPAFGIFSEIIATFSRKTLYGYKSMVFSIVGIAILSMVVWVHHFYTMGAGALVNSFFSITTMMIAVPTGVKMFNWMFTMRKGRIKMTTAMLWALAFIPCFVIGGVTGVMLGMGAADYQYHNTLFLVAHFHYVLIPGVVFAVFAGLYYWWPKIFGHMLNEKIGKWHFWLFVVGFNVTFMPMFFLGLDGAVRRAYTYSEESGFAPLFLLSTIGSIILALGFAAFCYNIYWSIRYADRNVPSDPWDARTLEWATASPVQHYNFTNLPEVTTQDAFWHMKKNNEGLVLRAEHIEEIHLPNNTGLPFIMCVVFGIAGFFMVFEWHIAAAVAALGIIVGLIVRSFDYNDGYHVHKEEIEETEQAWRNREGEVNRYVG